MQTSKLVSSIPPSPTLAIDARAKALIASGVDIVSFSAGEPDFGTPSPIVDAAIAGLKAGATRYTPVGGTNAMKGAIRAYIERRTGQSYTDSEIVASCGAKHTLYNLFQALLDPGDEVLIPTPAWVSYAVQIEMTGARAVPVAGDPERSFLPSLSDLEAAVTVRTRAILINNPSNPTGAFWDRAALEGLVGWLRKHPSLVVISDSIYDELVYDGDQCTELLTLAPELRDRYVLINGVSKSFAMTGWRLGYACAPANLVAAMTNLQSQSTSNPTAVTQVAATAALALGEEVIAPMRRAFEARRDLIDALLREIPGVRLVRPRGAFYAMPDFSAYLGTHAGERLIATDLDLAAWLLDEAKVAVVPGTPFFAPGYLRLSYATSEALIREGVGRIARAVATLARR